MVSLPPAYTEADIDSCAELANYGSTLGGISTGATYAQLVAATTLYSMANQGRLVGAPVDELVLAYSMWLSRQEDVRRTHRELVRDFFAYMGAPLREQVAELEY